MKRYILLCSILLIAVLENEKADAQRLTKENLQLLQKLEKQSAPDCSEMINGDHWFKRFLADSAFIRGFVNALKIKNSFDYPFKEFKTISKLYPPDSSFRIFTWQLMKDFTYYRQKGAIQMRTKDGSLKLFPLFDISSFTPSPDDSVRGPNWIGAIYYNIIEKTLDDGKKVYTLLGYDENGPRSYKKWMEILTFDDEGKPSFGGSQYFRFEPDSGFKPRKVTRLGIEYKKESLMRLVYEAETDMVVYDHLISENGEPENRYTYVSDGSYEGLKWVGDAWQHIPKIEHLVLKNGQAPLEQKLIDDDGRINQKKLDEQNRKNMLLQQEMEKDNSRRADNNKKQRSPQEKVEY